MKKTAAVIFILSFYLGYALDFIKTKSSLYPYSIKIPKTFTKEPTTRKNIDMKYIDKNGSSILVNVTSKLPEESKISVHDYSKEMFENAGNTVFSSQKIFIDGQKAFLIESTEGESSPLKHSVCFIFYKDKAYVITCTAPKKLFNDYKLQYQTTITSIDFN